MERTETDRILKGCELFKDLDEKEIETIARLCHVEEFDSGKQIIEQGDFVEHIYVIAQGRVILERTVDLGSRQANVPVDILGRGRIFGCWSTLLGEPHILMCTVTSQKPTKTLVIEGAELRRAMMADKELGFKIAQSLCLYLRKRLQVTYGAMEKL